MQQFSIDEWVVIPGQNTIIRGDVEKRLEPRVMDLLVYFAKHPGEALSRDRIIGNVWPHAYVSDSALQTAVSALRKAFADDPRRPAVIETIPKRGYRLIARSSAARPVVAVLPFKDLTGPGNREYLADGMTDALIAALGRNPSLRVISRHSVMLYKKSERRLPQIAAELGAGFAVEGSVFLDGNQLRITVQLVDATEDLYVWGETYATGVGRTFEVQRIVARDIAVRLATSHERDTVAPDVDPDAMMHYLRGRFHWYKLNAASFPRALDYFEKAIAIAPDFGAPHAGIADVWGALGYWGILPAVEAREHVEAALQKANAVDPDSPEVNMLFGAYFFFLERDWDAARGRLYRAIELNADLAHGRLLLALLHATLREPGAFDEIDQARRLDPLNPAVMLARAMCLARDGRYEEFDAEIELALEVEPSFQPAFELRAEAARVNGARDAMSWERRIWQADREISALFADFGSQRDLLFAIARLLEKRAQDSYVAPRVVARSLSLAGQPGAAIDVLMAAAANDDLMQVDFVQLTPAFAAVRRHARFRDLARALGLPRDAAQA